jgi:hypothetical protein
MQLRNMKREDGVEKSSFFSVRLTGQYYQKESMLRTCRSLNESAKLYNKNSENFAKSKEKYFLKSRNAVTYILSGLPGMV